MPLFAIVASFSAAMATLLCPHSSEGRVVRAIATEFLCLSFNLNTADGTQLTRSVGANEIIQCDYSDGNICELHRNATTLASWLASTPLLRWAAGMGGGGGGSDLRILVDGGVVHAVHGMVAADGDSTGGRPIMPPSAINFVAPAAGALRVLACSLRWSAVRGSGVEAGRGKLAATDPAVGRTVGFRVRDGMGGPARGRLGVGIGWGYISESARAAA
ncbi:hypothetical protein K438DRAFT_1765301 [Mycena galopus ATCC 62051]|nr:hypothetical protein K438DRAFT_1765301 [Mycena galopus ATCC 62051]